MPCKFGGGGRGRARTKRPVGEDLVGGLESAATLKLTKKFRKKILGLSKKLKNYSRGAQ